MTRKAGEGADEPEAPRETADLGTAFGAALSDLLWGYRKRQTDLSRELGTSPSYVNALTKGKKAAAAATVDRIADALGARPEDRVRLHRAAARDAGFKLDLPDDF